MELTFFQTGIYVEMTQASLDNELFLSEYLNLNKNDQSRKWKNLAAKIDFTEGEKFLFEILLSLKNDINALEKVLKNQNELLELDIKTHINGINFEYLKLKEEVLEEKKCYYARFELNSSKIAFFVEAINSQIAKITKIKNEDKVSYDAFIVDIQRELIKISKGIQ